MSGPMLDIHITPRARPKLRRNWHLLAMVMADYGRPPLSCNCTCTAGCLCFRPFFLCLSLMLYTPPSPTARLTKPFPPVSLPYMDTTPSPTARQTSLFPVHLPSHPFPHPEPATNRSSRAGANVKPSSSHSLPSSPSSPSHSYHPSASSPASFPPIAHHHAAYKRPTQEPPPPHTAPVLAMYNTLIPVWPYRHHSCRCTLH